MAASSEILLLKCAKFRDEGHFIDVRLKVSDDVFTAHRSPIDRPMSLKYRYMVIFLDTNDLLLINSFHPISKRHCLPCCFCMKSTS